MRGVLLEEGGGLGISSYTPKVLANNPRSICGLHGFPAGPKGLLMKQGMAAAHPTLHTHTNNAKLVDPNPCTAQAGDEATRTSCLSTRLSVP